MSEEPCYAIIVQWALSDVAPALSPPRRDRSSSFCAPDSEKFDDLPPGQVCPCRANTTGDTE